MNYPAAEGRVIWKINEIRKLQVWILHCRKHVQDTVCSCQTNTLVCWTGLQLKLKEIIVDNDLKIWLNISGTCPTLRPEIETNFVLILKRGPILLVWMQKNSDWKLDIVEKQFSLFNFLSRNGHGIHFMLPRYIRKKYCTGTKNVKMVWWIELKVETWAIGRMKPFRSFILA